MIDQGASLAAIEGMIAHHTAMLDALLKVRELMVAVAPRPPAAETQAPLQLMAPASKKRRPRRAGGDELIHEVEGTDITVTELQSRILDALAEAPDALHALQIAETVGNITPNCVKWAIEDLRERMKAAGCKAEINGYRGRGFRLEIDRGEA